LKRVGIYLIATAGKPRFSFGAEPIFPAANELTLIFFCRENTLKQVNGVPLSNDAMSRRVCGMAASVKIYCLIFIV
jgi:hypothetical protein